MCVIWDSSENRAVSDLSDQNERYSDNGIKLEYLGVTMDNNLNYLEHLDKIWKKTASRVRLLPRKRRNIGPYTAETIYKMMILPVTS